MFIKNELAGEEVDIVHKIEPEPLANCLHSVKLQILQILEDTQATECEIYLTGGNQFRERLATIRPYKGTRDPNHKPVYYKEIKEYLISRWDALVTDVIEADDAMAIEQYKHLNEVNSTNPSIICTNDKDLDMVPGFHHNFVTKETYLCEEYGSLSYNKEKNKLIGQGLMWFYAQMILGDSADNIEGIPGKGPKYTFELLKAKTSELDLYQTVRNEYIAYITKTWPEDSEKDISNIEQDADMRLLETGQLLWMRRTPEDIWQPPSPKNI